MKSIIKEVSNPDHSMGEFILTPIRAAHHHGGFKTVAGIRRCVKSNEDFHNTGLNVTYYKSTDGEYHADYDFIN